MPEDMAGFLAMTDVEVSNGALFDDRRVLSKIIGRATTPMKDTVAKALA
jgi:NAD(P)H dehydrogenase (quinone)